jgi:hypothetical protein
MCPTQDLNANDPTKTRIAEVQQLLALALVAQVHALGHQTYPVYAWRIAGECVSLAAAHMLGAYLAILGSGHLPNAAGALQLLHLAACDLRHEHGQCNAVRMAVGVYRALFDRFRLEDLKRAALAATSGSPASASALIPPGGEAG